MSPLPDTGGMQGGRNPYLSCLANGQFSTLCPRQRDAEECSGPKVHVKEWKQRCGIISKGKFRDAGILRIIVVLLFLLQTPTRRAKRHRDHRLHKIKCYSANPNNPSRMLNERNLFSVRACQKHMKGWGITSKLLPGAGFLPLEVGGKTINLRQDLKTHF